MRRFPEPPRDIQYKQNNGEFHAYDNEPFQILEGHCASYLPLYRLDRVGRRQRLGVLVEKGRERRPDIDWGGYAADGQAGTETPG